MDWLTDEAIEEFLVTPLLRVETTEIFQANVGKAWVVLDAEKRRYLGSITRSGNGYYAFTADNKRGTRMTSFSAAVQLIELSKTSSWVEDIESNKRHLRSGVVLPEET